MRLSRLTYVHEGDPGKLGQLITEIRGTLRFDEGSGLIEIGAAQSPRSGPPPGAATVEANIRIAMTAFSALPPEQQSAVGADLPCILGHTEHDSEVLVPSRGIARWSGSLSDLRGKIRYGLARVGWML